MTKTELLEEIRIANIIPESIVDGPGFRLTVFVQGCPHRCPGCHNPQTHPFEGGKIITVEKILADFMKNPLLSGITLSGGEPFEQAKPLAVLSKEVKNLGKSIVIYSGYTFEELQKRAEKEKEIKKLLSCCDWLIDGPFIQEQRSLELKFKGSKNQRIIDMKKSLDNGKVFLVELDK